MRTAAADPSVFSRFKIFIPSLSLVLSIGVVQSWALDLERARCTSAILLSRVAYFARFVRRRLFACGVTGTTGCTLRNSFLYLSTFR